MDLGQRRDSYLISIFDYARPTYHSLCMNIDLVTRLPLPPAVVAARMAAPRTQTTQGKWTFGGPHLRPYVGPVVRAARHGAVALMRQWMAPE